MLTTVICVLSLE